MKHTDSDDLTLVRAFREGDDRAFEEIVRRYQRQVANVVYLTMGGRGEVEDLTQEVFMRVYRSMDRVAVETSLFSWIYRIATNVCIDELRRRKIRRVLSMDPTTESSGQHHDVFEEPARTSDALLAREQKDQVLGALAKLTPAHRAALVLREYEDMSYREIAASLGISEQAVKSRIFRAREELKELLKGYFKERL